MPGFPPQWDNISWAWAQTHFCGLFCGFGLDLSSWQEKKSKKTEFRDCWSAEGCDVWHSAEIWIVSTRTMQRKHVNFYSASSLFHRLLLDWGWGGGRGCKRRREEALEEFGGKQECGQSQSHDCVLAYKKRRGWMQPLNSSNGSRQPLDCRQRTAAKYWPSWQLAARRC